MSNYRSYDKDKQYVVLQVALREALVSTKSGNLYELEDLLNKKYEEGYRLHTISTTILQSTGLFGGDRVLATAVFEKI